MDAHIVRNALCRSQRNIGGMHSTAGRTAEAVTALEAARTLQEELAAASRGAPSATRDLHTLTGIHIALADLALKGGRWDDAVASAARAVASADELAATDFRKANVVGADMSARVVTAHLVAAELYARTDRLADAERHLAKVADLAARIGRENPSRVECWTAWARSLLVAAELHAARGDVDAAIRSCGEAEGAWKSRADAAKDWESRAAQAEVLRTAGLLRVRAGRAAEAVPYLERAAEHLATVIPPVGPPASHLGRAAEVSAELGAALAEVGKSADGLAWLAKARETTEKLAAGVHDNPEMNHALARVWHLTGRTLARRGNADEAAAAYKTALPYLEAAVKAVPAVTVYRQHLDELRADVLRATSNREKGK
jgi:tetratricopeptide (TPR) repeat protein